MTAMQSISPQTQFCMVIGDPIGHSLSPAIHNAAFNALGLDYVYLASRVKDVRNALAGMRALANFRGMSITIPHKIAAMQYVDAVDPVDQAIGSINTVINDKGYLVGFGTDGPGALKALVDAGVAIDEKQVLMLGAGGAARAIAFTLANQTRLQRLTILDIDDSLRDELSVDLKNGTSATIEDRTFNDETLAAAMAEADVIVHCTPIGMHPKADASLVPQDLFRKDQVVLDIVYSPLETRLLSEAKASGLQVISGVEMFVNQAVLQFERFCGAQAPVDIMRQVVLEQLAT
ncbi:MAG: shikimate dehydrogenase [Desulfobacteraceae bacterium]